ncbi:MAG: glycoside hydrolase family 9 protein [Ignavibacteriae bacterium]|nr:glycoside hydrolase family 9 protein [Ignavibacteriota bacterium]
MKYFILISFIIVNFSNVYPSKFIKVSIVDKDYLAIYFKDGEVIYKDDANGPSAYLGHGYSEDADYLIGYGNELSVLDAGNTYSWTIQSSDDQNYKSNGLHPTEVYRKSKVNNTDHNWNYKLDHWIYLKLPISLTNGATYQIKINPKTNSNISETQITFNIFKEISEAIHVNLIGYTPNSPIKSADVYIWLGDGGARDYSSFQGNSVWIYNVDTEEKFNVGNVSFWKKSQKEASDRNLIGSDVWTADFNEFSTPGKYRLIVDEIGSSNEFEIRDSIYFEPYKTSVRGYFYMRVGQDSVGITPVPRRPLFIPEKDPKGFKVYLTDLNPFQPIWAKDEVSWDEPHFIPAKKSIFWKHRLPGNPINLNAYGGHSDALDWDRHLAHVSNIYDLLLPYYLSNGKLSEDNLNIAESRNGIPDIIDEARNEVDFWLRLRDGEAYSHGLTNPSKETTIMFQAGTTSMAAWANAANCAMLADCFRISGNADLKEYYKKEAITAFTFADKQKEKQLDETQDIGDASMRGRDFKMMAAAFLYNLTGDIIWENIIEEETEAKSHKSQIANGDNWTQTWATAAYLFSPQKINYPDLYKNMKSSVINQAMENNVKYMYQRPSRRSSNNNWWQTAENLQMVVLAHAISDEPKLKEILLRSMILEADYGLGRNPSNIIEMTGLGKRNIVNCYTSGRNDGTPGLHPGHTPYNNLEPWGTAKNGDGNPRWFSDRGYPDWDKGGWPYQEAHFNSRYSWANGEFTPRQTMRGKMALLGYLHSID